MKEGSNKNFGDRCVEWFINGVLDIETYMKKFSQNDTDLNPDTIIACFDRADSASQASSMSKCRFCEK